MARTEGYTMYRAVTVVLVVAAMFLAVVRPWQETPTVNAMAKANGYAGVETLPERDVRVQSRIRAWVGDCPAQIVRHKGSGSDTYEVRINASETPVYVGGNFPSADYMREQLLTGKAAKARGVTKVTREWIYPPYLCDPRKPYSN